MSQLPAGTRSEIRCGFQAARVFVEDSVRRPWVRYDYVGSRIPIAVLIDAGVEAVSIIDIHLRELNRTIGRNFHGIDVSTRQLVVRLDFSRRQTACAHANHLVVAHFCDDRVVADFSDFVLSVLMELVPKKVVTVVVMSILGQREAGGHQHAGANDELHKSSAIEHICFSISSDSHESRYNVSRLVRQFSGDNGMTVRQIVRWHSMI
jgi:hypothetical protein